MNPNIAQLALLPRGKPHCSRLDRFEQEIRYWRNAKISYRQIAILLAELGFFISASAVHDYVRVRDVGRGRRQYALPELLVGSAAVLSPCKGVVAPPAVSQVVSVTPELMRAPKKKYVYLAKPDKQTHLDDAQLQINNPLQLNPTKTNEHTP